MRQINGSAEVGWEWTEVFTGGDATVDRFVGAKLVGEIDAGAYIRRKQAEDAAVGIDGNGEGVIGDAQQPAAIFASAHAGHAQVLLGGGGAAKPAVVGDVDEKRGTVGGEAPHFIGKNRLVADERAECDAAG